MNRILLLLIVPFILFACSSDDNEPTQDYTSFVFYLPNNIDVTLTNSIAAYKSGNEYYRLGKLGDITRGQTSSEIKVENNSIKEIYFFTDYNGCVRFDKTFILTPNIKNRFILEENIGGLSVTDKSDPKQYPQ